MRYFPTGDFIKRGSANITGLTSFFLCWLGDKDFVPIANQFHDAIISSILGAEHKEN